MTRPPVYLVDASIYIFKYYFALPPNWIATNGFSTEAVYGFATFLLKFLQTERPVIMAVCFDESLGNCFRNELYADYKASRALPDDALAYQLNACRRLTELMGLPCFSSTRYEADDLLATLAYGFRTSENPVVVLSRDKDLGQLLYKAKDCLLDYGSAEPLFAGDIHAKFGVRPEQIPDYLALVGDTIDDIPGVPGIGKKTAQLLLSHFTSVEALLLNYSEIDTLALRGKQRIIENIIENAEQLRISKLLATAAIDAPLSTPVNTVSDLAVTSPDVAALCDLFDELGFPRLKSKLKSLRNLCS